MNEKCKLICEKAEHTLKNLEWVAQLLARITVGYVFVESGWGKFQHLDKVVSFFTDLGIPAPQLQAPFVAGVELVGGALVLVGLMTRLACVPLIITMIVAILTAKKDDISGFSDLLGMSEYLYIVIFVWLLFSGSGKISLDTFCCRKKLDRIY